MSLQSMQFDVQANPNGPTTYKMNIYPPLSGIPTDESKVMGNAPLMSTQVIPIDATLGYEALTHNVPPVASSYFGIDDAYPSFPAGTCTRFVLRKCDGTVDTPYITDSLPAHGHN